MARAAPSTDRNHEAPRELRSESGIHGCGTSRLRVIRARDVSRRIGRTGCADWIGTPHDLLPVHHGHVCQRKLFARVSGNVPRNGDLRMRVLHRRSRRFLVDLGTELLFMPVIR
jgi:hypothetical protein